MTMLIAGRLTNLEQILKRMDELEHEDYVSNCQKLVDKWKLLNPPLFDIKDDNTGN